MDKCIIDGCENTCIDGHTLTQSTITKDLKESINKNDKVYTYLPKERSFKDIGWRKASTFKFTCRIHDNDIFRPIENNTKINIKDSKHLFLHTFRSFLYVYALIYRKIKNKKNILFENPKEFSFNDDNYLTYSGNIITNEDVWFQKFILNKNIFFNNLYKHLYLYSNYITITIDKNIGISGCGVLELPFVDMGYTFFSNDTPIVNSPMSVLTLLSKDDKTYVILSFNNDYNTEMSLRQLFTIDFNYQDKFDIPGRNKYPIHININFDDVYSNNILNIVSKLVSKSCRDNIYIKPSVYDRNETELLNLFNNTNFNMTDYLSNNINIFTLK